MGVHVEEQGWFSRIGGAIKGILFGGLLTVISVPLLFWNEGRAVKTAKGLKEGAKVVVEIQPEAIDPGNDGKFVHAAGMVKTNDVLRDDEFNLEYNGIRLTRHVEMFQWKEKTDRDTKKKLGGGTKTVTTYSYEKDWFDRVIDSSSFDEAAAHQNPTDFLFANQSNQAKNVSLGQFQLPSSLVGMIGAKEPVTLTEDNIPESVRSFSAIRNDGPDGSSLLYVKRGGKPIGGNTISEADRSTTMNKLADTTNPNRPELVDLESGALESGKNAQDDMADSVQDSPTMDMAAPPQIGDVRVWFTATPVNTVSLISQQTGETFQPYETSYGTTINVLREGTLSAAEMIAQEEAANRVLTWVLRGVGTFVMFLGFSLLLRPLVVLADVVPMFGSLVGFGTAIVAGLLTVAGAMTVMGIAWVFYRPLLGGTLLAVAIGAVFMLYRRAQSKRTQPETLNETDLA